MSKYFCIVLLLLCICAAVSAAQFGVTAGYYGETLAHPGLYVDLSYMVPVSSWYSSGGSVSFLGYHHQRNHTAAAIHANMVNRIHVTRDFGLDLRLGGGYALRVPSGSVYVDGEDPLSLGERISSGISMKAETALFFTLKDHAGTSIEMLLGLSLFTENDYNGYVLPHLSTIAGLMFLHEQGALE